MSQGHHITSIKTLTMVISALVILTLLTVFTAQIDLGGLNVPIALAIAITKAALVVTIFMALKWDNKINAAILGVGVLFVIVFISFVLFDTTFRGDLSNTTKGTIADIEASEAELEAREPDASALEFNRTPE